MIADLTAAVLLPMLGGIARLACTVPAARAIARGADPPALVSWLVWTATTGLATVTSILAGAPVAAAVPAKRARATRLDWTCLTLCGLTGTVWAVAALGRFGDPVTVATVVLCAAIATDGIASGPTWRLAWQGKEPWLLWLGAVATPLLTLLVLRGNTVADWAYPIYEMCLCGGIFLLTVAPRYVFCSVAAVVAGAAVGAAGALAGLPTAVTGAALVALALAVGAAPWLIERRRPRYVDPPTIPLGPLLHPQVAYEHYLRASLTGPQPAPRSAQP